MGFLGLEARKGDTVLDSLVRVLLILSAVPFLLAQQAGPKAHPATSGKACLDCHAKVRAHKVLHYPVQERLCDSCHQVPPAGGAAALADTPEKLCLTCHEKFTGSFVHGPVALGACVVCHDPHGSQVPHLLRVSGRAQCLSCHADIESRLAKARFQHKALESGCTSCHSPHASGFRYQLKAEKEGLCAPCHAKVVDQAAGAVVKHSAVREARACLNCHDPHAADHRPQLGSDGADTCLKCHNRKVVAGGVELTDMKKLLAESPDHHGPIREKDCAGCHQAHGSANFRLLRHSYPKDFYAPFKEENFALCFSCHDAALSRDERTSTLTDFRHGDRNLHFVHVNKNPKGRTCRSCHETHASTLPNHIRTSVPFGNWQLPINFTKTASGGACAPGCHAPQRYDRNQPAQAKVQP